MPIPEFNTDEITWDELVDKYEEEGWYKVLEFDWIEVNPRTREPQKVRYRMSADSIPCTGQANNIKCSNLRATFLRLAPHGVIWQCFNCRKTDGPISFDEGQQLSREDISVNEAWKIINKTNQVRPIGLTEPATKKSPKIIMRDRRR